MGDGAESCFDIAQNEFNDYGSNPGWQESQSQQAEQRKKDFFASRESFCPLGKVRCMQCKGIFDHGELVQIYPHPDSPVGCAKCAGLDD